MPYKTLPRWQKARHLQAAPHVSPLAQVPPLVRSTFLHSSSGNCLKWMVEIEVRSGRCWLLWRVLELLLLTTIFFWFFLLRVLLRAVSFALLPHLLLRKKSEPGVKVRTHYLFAAPLLFHSFFSFSPRSSQFPLLLILPILFAFGTSAIPFDLVWIWLTSVRDFIFSRKKGGSSHARDPLGAQYPHCPFQANCALVLLHLGSVLSWSCPVFRSCFVGNATTKGARDLLIGKFPGIPWMGKTKAQRTQREKERGNSSGKSGLRFSTYLVLALKEIVYQVFELKSITLGNLEQIINKFRKWLFKKCWVKKVILSLKKI